MKTIFSLLFILSLSLLIADSYAGTPMYTGDGYAVQIAVSNTPIQTTDAKFKGVTDVQEETCTGDYKYKYTTGWTPKFSEAWVTKKKMADIGFKDAFVVAYRNGVRTTGKATASPDAT